MNSVTQLKQQKTTVITIQTTVVRLLITALIKKFFQ